MYTYLLILLFTIFFPFIRSFESRVHFVQYWKPLFRAIIPVAIVFIVADMIFTHMGVWSFNTDRIIGIYIVNLPLEECLFFIAVPYACIFLYEVLNYFFPLSWSWKTVSRILTVIIVLLVTTGVYYYDRWYTLVYCIATAAFLAWHVYLQRSPYLANFIRCYAVCLIPFFLVNGLLTALPVVLYNPAEFTGIRLYTIPAEDVVYGAFLILAVITLYERNKELGVRSKE